jgi:hypothetical protein
LYRWRDSFGLLLSEIFFPNPVKSVQLVECICEGELLPALTITREGIAMRKWLGPVGMMFLMVGLLFAAEGTISKVDLDKKTVTIKEGDKDNDYKFDDKVKVTVAGGKAKGGKGKDKEGTYADFEKSLKVGEKLTFEAKDGVLTEVKITAAGKKKGKGKASD